MSKEGDITLNPTDKAILDHLRKGRCTPNYLAKLTGYTRGNVTSRLSRLVEHGYVEKVHKGLYTLVDDPENIKEGYVISVTDEQLNEISAAGVATISTERAQYILVHSDHEQEALASLEDSDVELRKQHVAERE
jgi:DNA-binding MarR family transcriptional regulator